ncbi:hypothetical protein CYMTET_20974 [Cymbomonas tetramitiformis]|uniref:Uncharacterized protein n=1 Tax=Cymbomonas tetramitiformis TaxID=36881 RepID=A0AAE0L3L6_9CHLO|nr:hypothetical protein CYMTET_20974 [Cymbomonas tetramitiformis]
MSNPFGNGAGRHMAPENYSLAGATTVVTSNTSNTSNTSAPFTSSVPSSASQVPPAFTSFASQVPPTFMSSSSASPSSQSTSKQTAAEYVELIQLLSASLAASEQNIESLERVKTDITSRILKESTQRERLQAALHKARDAMQHALTVQSDKDSMSES